MVVLVNRDALVTIDLIDDIADRKDDVGKKEVLKAVFSHGGGIARSL